MDVSIIIFSIIDKLPPRKTKKLVKRKEDITLEELVQHLQIEAEYKLNTLEDYNIMSSTINMIEEEKEFKQPHKPKKSNQKRNFDSNKDQNSQKKKHACHQCGKPGHYRRECCLLKKQKGIIHIKFHGHDI